MGDQPRGGIYHRDDMSDELARRAGARHHHLETDGPRLGRGRLSHREQRQGARAWKHCGRTQGAQRVAAGRR